MAQSLRAQLEASHVAYQKLELLNSQLVEDNARLLRKLGTTAPKQKFRSRSDDAIRFAAAHPGHGPVGKAELLEWLATHP